MNKLEKDFIRYQTQIISNPNENFSRLCRWKLYL